MRVDPIRHHPAVLDVLVVGVVRAGHLELVVVEQAGGGVDVGEGLGVLVADDSDYGHLVVGHFLEGCGDLADLEVVLGRTGDQRDGLAEVECKDFTQHH